MQERSLLSRYNNINEITANSRKTTKKQSAPDPTNSSGFSEPEKLYKSLACM